MTVIRVNPISEPVPARPVRVAHVITRLCRGGAQENTFQTVRLHDRDRFHADLIAGPPLGSEGSLEDTIAQSGLSICRVRTLIREPRPVADLRALQQLTRTFARGRYDIVHTHTSKAGYLGRLAARRAGVPIVVHTSHGNVFHGYFGRWPTAMFVAMERHAARWTDALIELTDRSVDECLEHHIGDRGQYHVIPSGIDVRRFQLARSQRGESRRRFGWREDELIVGAVARLEPVKGIDTFVRAATQLSKHQPNARFVVAGDGSQRPELERLAAPFADRIVFLGYRSDIAEIIGALDVLVVPSRNEGMGRVILEAGAAGVPVVASRVGGIVDVLRDNKTGLLVDPDDAAAFADAIGQLLRDELRRTLLGTCATKFIGQNFDHTTMIQRIESLYERLLSKKNALS